MVIDKMIADVLKKEAGYVNHKADKAGATNLGITQATLTAYLGRKATVQDVKALSKDTASAIYKKNYYFKPGIDKLPILLQPIIFDNSVNSGPARAIKILQQALHDKGYDIGAIDGVIGTRTVQYAEKWVSALGTVAVDALVDYRVKFYRQIVANDPSQKVFEHGWLSRAESFRTGAA